MTSRLTFDTGLSLLALQLLTTDRIEAFATAALQEGFDSNRLRQLAGPSPDQQPDLSEAVAALAEIGIEIPSRSEAARRLASVVSDDIVSRRADPFEAAGWLATISWAVDADFHELDPFIYIHSEAAGRPGDREFFRAAIVAEARRWVETGKGST